VPVIADRLTGEVRQAQIFVAVMGASNFTYVEATWTQTLGDWIGPHTRALAAIDGAPPSSFPTMQSCCQQGLPLRAAGRPNLCRDGGALRHRCAADQAAPARDKAKVEACVLIALRWNPQTAPDRAC
jgi:transposase